MDIWGCLLLVRSVEGALCVYIGRSHSVGGEASEGVEGGEGDEGDEVESGERGLGGKRGTCDVRIVGCEGDEVC